MFGLEDELGAIIEDLNEQLIQVSAELQEYKIQNTFLKNRVFELEDRMDDIRTLTDVSL